MKKEKKPKDGKNKKDKRKDAAHHQGKWYNQYYQQIQPNELQPLQQWFQLVDKDRSGEVDAMELTQAQWPGNAQFSVDTCNKLITVFDKDRSGTMTFYEYAALHKYILHLQNVFFSVDSNRSGTLEPNELQQALHQAGFQTDENSVRPFLRKVQGPLHQSITFSSFCVLCVQLSYIRDMFAKYDPKHTGRVTLDSNEFFKCMLSGMV